MNNNGIGWKIAVAVLSGALLTGIGGGLTLWRDFAVLSTEVRTAIKSLDDHEARIRVVENRIVTIQPPQSFPH